ncbi:MAG: Fic family protein [Mycobacterium sp.]|nr:Fic family protein [Mycobacterium sp.]
MAKHPAHQRRLTFNRNRKHQNAHPETIETKVTQVISSSNTSCLTALNDLLAEYFYASCMACYIAISGHGEADGGSTKSTSESSPSRSQSNCATHSTAICYRWQHTSDWRLRQLGIAGHAETVRIHPFTNGNGCSTRLLAGLVFMAAQEHVGKRSSRCRGSTPYSHDSPSPRQTRLDCPALPRKREVPPPRAFPVSIVAGLRRFR